MEDLTGSLRQNAAAFEKAVARLDAADTPEAREAARLEAERLRQAGVDLLSRLGSRIEDELSSLPEGLRAVIEDAAKPTPRSIVTDRSSLEAVPTTGTLESMLERGLSSLLGRVPTGWLAREEEKGGHRLTLADLGAPFSLLSNIRAGRETGQHPFARALLQARDFADDRVDRDVYGSALSIAEIARLGELLPVLDGVHGSDERVRQLWGKDRPRAMNTLYELVVAGALAEFGRDVEFVPETDRKTPDLRVHDATGVSTFVECKRKQGLTRAEIAEERAVRELFDVLAGRADRISTVGTFTAEFASEPGSISHEEFALVVDATLQTPGTESEAPWGRLTFQPSSEHVETGLTIAYSPVFLHRTFGYNSAQPTVDGFIGRVRPPSRFRVTSALRPLGLMWKSTSPESAQVRARGLRALFQKAVGQFPPGSIGITYIAYQDGARPILSNERVEHIAREFKETELRRRVHLPVIFVNRLIARPLGHGAPDLIESTIEFADSHGGEVWVDEFPSTVYTVSST